ncbi:MAG: M48 family metallopeptidase [Actinobacteria bacterium]|nr:M48 family metallopeptidase [Actinomycetota bacterium]
MEYESSLNYKVSYRDIKYPRVELKTGKTLFVLPFGYNPNILYEKHKSWIFKKINFIEECLDNAKNKELVERSYEEFKKLIYSVVKKISCDLEIKIKQVYFRKMRTKWASLSQVRNLTANKFMKYLPGYLIEYIIFHELVHVTEKKHSSRFWVTISGKYNDYQKLEKELFEYWFKVSEKVGM